MTRIHCLLLCLPLLVLDGCWALPASSSKGDFAGTGEQDIYVYMEAFPGEAERLSFALAGIAVERDDGSEVPLLLRKREFSGMDMKHQRLVAHGRLEAGGYRGFSFSVKKAALTLEAGEAALLLPEEPVRKHAPFRIEKKTTTCISLVLNVRDSLHRGYLFSPVFQSVRPERPLPGLTGYVTSQGSGSIMVFDKKRLVLTGAIFVGRGPKGIEIDPVSERAYVAMSGDDAVQVVDIAAGQVVNRISLLRGDKPQDAALSPDRKTLVVVNGGSNSVSFIDVGSSLELDRIGIGEAPHTVVADGKGKAYIFSTFANTISIVDISGRTLIAAVPTDSGPIQGAFNRKGDRLYVLYAGSPYLNVLDPSSFSVVRRVYTGMQPTAIKVDTNTDMIYVARHGAPEVDVYDPFSLLPVETIRTGSSTDFMTIDADSNVLFLLSWRDETLTAVHLNSKSILSRIDVGRGPFRVRVIGER